PALRQCAAHRRGCGRAVRLCRDCPRHGRARQGGLARKGSARMTSVEAPLSDPPEPIGLASLAKRAFDGEDLAPLSSELIQRMIAEPENAAVLMDLATIEHLYGNRGDALD